MAAPVVSSVSPNQGPASGGTTVTVTGSGFTGASLVRFGSKTAAFTVNSSTQITAVSPSGTGTVNVTVTTSQGTSTQQVTFTYAQTPSLSSLSPGQGPAAGGTTVTLTGTNLSGATAVRFDGVATSFTVDSATQITAVTPAHAAGAAAVTVTTPGGTSNALTFTYLATPAVTGVSPERGPASGGTTVTLTGANLTGATAVRFDGLAATSFTVDSATQITAVTPAHAAGAAAVTVTTPAGTSNPDDPSAHFYYAAPPSLTSLSPPSGTTAGGTLVTLTGNNLLGATAVRFDGTSATSFAIDSATQITALAPAHAAGAAAVTVTTPGGTSNPVGYTYLSAPALTSLAPASGPTHAGAVVTLTGSNLATTTSVKFGSTPAAFTVVSPTQVTAVVPAGPAGPVTITATNPAGTSNGLTYQRTGAPAV
ncbi:IPT/TIG domain-containing protein [Streptomyces sp. S.PNR 29]|uniref:IPT/TIG domain-containing protein n=1 Tax=Streptomyces sp. S.PNR 29 TaxID=2973805 RepID=UPI0025AFEFB9|nr:IPT/TIG domain-containing protein [Streptomyces sp. S.PNR 29]MDN0194554.1 IPT/TIG domain-containing protein [Streptomyces sp. S.PNR 29]